MNTLTALTLAIIMIASTATGGVLGARILYHMQGCELPKTQ